MKLPLLFTTLIVTGMALAADYPIVDTGQGRCYDARTEITFPNAGQDYL